MKLLFFDTNALLHYRFPTAMDRRVLADMGHVVLVITTVVLKELDQHKNTSNQKLLRKRATAAVRQLNEIHEGDAKPTAPSLGPIEGLDPGLRFSIARDVELAFDVVAPPLDAADDLSPSWNDDRLLAHVLRLKRLNPSLQVEVVSADLALKLSALRFGLTVREPPSSEKLPDEPDPNEKRILELQDEIAAFQTAIPKLRLTFVGGETVLRVPFCRYGPATPEEVGKLLRGVKAKIPKMLTRAERKQQLATNPLFTVSLFTDEQISAYNEQVEKYWTEYKQYLAMLHVTDSTARTVRLELELSNVGGKPAEHVELELIVRADAEITTAAPEMPTVPTKPERRTLGVMGYDLADLARPSWNYRDVANLRLPVPPDLSTAHIAGNRVSFETGRLLHSRSEACAPLYVTFKDIDSVKSFGVNYTAFAASCPRPTTAELGVVISPVASGSILSRFFSNKHSPAANSDSIESDPE